MVATPVLANPSRWAAEYVDAAIELGLVPNRLQSNFQRTATRGEFSSLAVALYESHRGVIRGRVFFGDTNNPDVEKAAYIGIVSGVGGNRFNPYGNITREQAAVFITRLMEAIGYPLPPFQGSLVFADSTRISSWAQDSVGRVHAAGIMSGVGNNMFSPQGTYTREQSIATVMRLHTIIEYGELVFVTPQPPTPTPVPTATPVPTPTPASTPFPTPTPSTDTAPTATPSPREAPFSYTTSNITIQNRRMTDAEHQEWIDEYNAMGGASAFELEVIRLVNVERANYNLPPVVICHTLSMAARFYAQTMANLNTTLGHREGPYGGSGATADAFGDRVVAVRAQNGIAGRWTPEAAVQGWMDSPGHRANILWPTVTRIGVGFHLGGRWGVFGYQIFGGGSATPTP